MTLKRSNKGFTLIELMIVVAIIGILAAVAIPKFADLVTKSKEAAIKGHLGSVRSALSIYYGDTEGLYPVQDAVVAGLTTGGRYLDGATGLGQYDVPKHTANPGHNYGKITLDTQVTQNSLTATGVPLINNETNALNYSSSTGQIVVSCTHVDTKNLVWSSY